MTKNKKPQRYLNCAIDWEVKSIAKDASGKMVIKGYANTPHQDRVSDVVLPTAFEDSLPEYMENPVALFQHNWDKVIGKCIKAEIITEGENQGLYVEIEISNAADVEEVKTKIAEGILKTFSIGYNEVEADFDQNTGVNVVKKLELLEISVVTIPCNPKAKFTVDVQNGESQANPEEKMFDDMGFVKFFIDAVKELDDNEEMTSEFIKQIYDIYKGGPGSGRRGGGGKTPADDASSDYSEQNKKESDAAIEALPINKASKEEIRNILTDSKENGDDRAACGDRIRESLGYSKMTQEEIDEATTLILRGY